MTSDRIRTRIPAWFRAGRQRVKGEVRNLSRGGLFMGAASFPQEGDPVQIEIEPPGRMAVQVTGLVWWTRSEQGKRPTGFGLRVVDDSEAYRNLVDSLR